MESVNRLKNFCLKSVDALEKQQNKIFSGLQVFQYAIC